MDKYSQSLHKEGAAKCCQNDFSNKLDCYPVVQRIKNHVLDPCARLRSVFTKIDPNQGWQITRQELKKAVELGLQLRLSEDEFKELTSILDPGNTNMVNCNDFLDLFDKPCDGPFEGGDSSIVDEQKQEKKYRGLRGTQLKNKLKNAINDDLWNIEKAILVCDPQQSGYISPESLHTVLNGFCFPLTGEQFGEMLSGLQLYGSNVNYREFLDSFKKAPGEDTKQWTSTVSRLATFKSRCPPELPLDEAEEMLRECLQARKSAALKDFKALDVCNVGVACKDDARNVLNKFSFRFNDKQFEALWKKFPRNKFNQLLYDQFLEEFAGGARRPTGDGQGTAAAGTGGKAGGGGSTASERDDSGRRSSSPGSGRSGPAGGTEGQGLLPSQGKPVKKKNAKESLCARAPHLKPLLDSMEPVIVRNIRDIRFHLRRADPKVTGGVDFSVLKGILAKCGIFFRKEDEFALVEQFDDGLSGKINYRDFLRIFVWYV